MFCLLIWFEIRKDYVSNRILYLNEDKRCKEKYLKVLLGQNIILGYNQEKKLDHLLNKPYVNRVYLGEQNLYLRC